jgi:hypothetical protein
MIVTWDVGRVVVAYNRPREADPCQCAVNNDITSTPVEFLLGLEKNVGYSA